MRMNIISVCVLGVFAVLGGVALRKYNGELAAMMMISAVVLMCVMAIPVLSELFSSVRDLTSAANINSEYISVLIKSLGICYITQISVDICRENCSSSVASQIEIAGKLIILLLAVPLYGDLIAMIYGFLNS